ncbi:MAG: twin-arginine translocase TatA/TatE family subunit [Opitutales bacterium]
MQQPGLNMIREIRYVWYWWNRVVFIIVLLLFGAKRMPKIARSFVIFHLHKDLRKCKLMN